jgi:hypothetical protein
VGAEGQADAVEWAPRASAYAWKRAAWLSSSVFDGVELTPEARACLPFGCRASDFVH